MTKQPDWFLQLQRDLSAPVIVPDGAIIDWGQCRDRFLVLLLQRLETRTTSHHPAIVRQLLERRLAGDDVAAWAAAAWAAAADDAAECTAQVADLQAAIAASIQQPALPANYIDGNIIGPDRELLSAFYEACNSEGGTTDEMHLRGIRAVLARAASGFIMPTEVQVASPAPAEEALQRLVQWGGWRSSIGYNADVVLGVVDWANGGMVGPLPPLPEWLQTREAAQPAAPTPVNLAALHDPTFSDGLTAAQHRDVLRGGPDPRSPAPTDTDATRLVEKLGWLFAQLADIDWSDDSLTVAQAADLLQQQAATIADLEAVVAGYEGDALLAITPADVPLPTNNLAPVPVADSLPHWAIPAAPTKPAEVQP